VFLARRRPFDELSVNPLSSQFSQTIMPDVAQIKVVLNTSLEGANTMFGEACEYGLNTGDVIQSTDFGKMVPLCVTKPGDLKFDNDILSCCKKQWSQIEHKLEDGVLGVMASLPISTLFDDGVELILAADGAPKEGTPNFKKLMRSIGPVTAVACTRAASPRPHRVVVGVRVAPLTLPRVTRRRAPRQGPARGDHRLLAPRVQGAPRAQEGRRRAARARERHGGREQRGRGGGRRALGAGQRAGGEEGAVVHVQPPAVRLPRRLRV
jgi:hypothetical protein